MHLHIQAAWDESLAVTGTDVAQVQDVEDDLTRELAFYNQVMLRKQRACAALIYALQRGDS